jgi:hypothetical protein
MKVRCKFVCESVTKQKHWNKPGEFLYDAKFSAVMGNSEENKKFWEASPSGCLNVNSVLPDAFEPGQEYYLDITPAPIEATDG